MADKETGRALVLGVGNILMGDEGLGVRVVELFEKGYSLPAEVDCVDGGVAGVALLGYFKDYTNIIIVDAVSSGAAPATIHRFRGAEIKDIPPTATNAHQIGIKELIAISRFEGAHPGIIFIGIVPQDISFSIGLTPLVEAALPMAAEIIMEELCALGFEVGRKDA